MLFALVRWLVCGFSSLSLLPLCYHHADCFLSKKKKEQFMESSSEQFSPPLLRTSSPAGGRSGASKPSLGSSSSTATTPVKGRAAPEVEERWREVSGLKAKDEVLLGEFQCSYTGDLIVSNGTLFLSTNYAVFYSSLGALSVKQDFAFVSVCYLTGKQPKVKKLVIPWLSVRAIEQSVTNYDVSSGIKLQLKDGQVRHFTQFMSRDSVYDQMIRIWTRAKQNAEMFSNSSDPESDGKALLFDGSGAARSLAPGSESATTSALPSPLSAELASAVAVSSSSAPSSFSSQVPAVAAAAIGPPPNLSGAQPAPTITVAISEHWVEPSSEPAEKPVILPIGLEEFERMFLDDEGAFFNAFHSGFFFSLFCGFLIFPKRLVLAVPATAG